MKNIKLYIPIIMAAAFFSCQPQEQAQYLSLSMTSWSFASGQSDTVDVAVLSSDPDWTVQGGTEWLYVSKADDGTLKMVAMANEGADGREALVVVECGNGLSAELEVNQFGTSFTGVMEDFVEMHAEGALSKSGEWFCGVEVFGYDDQGVYARYRPVIINLETGDREKYKETTYEKCLAISDDGRTIILGNEGNMEFAVMVDGEFIEMPLPEGYRNPAYQNMSADGSVIIGFAQLVDDNWNPYRPIAWRNGDAEILEVPEVNATGQSLGMGVMARACSSDGSVIYGSEWDYNNIILGVRGNLHYEFVDRLDTYAGLMLGYEIVNSSSSVEGYGESISGDVDASGFAFSIHIGTRYYFTERFAAGIEVGYGVAYANVGVAYKF